MPSDAYIKAAKQSGRKPVTLMSIESIDAIKATYSTRTDWDGSAALDKIDTAIISGVATPTMLSSLANSGASYIIPTGPPWPVEWYDSLAGTAAYDQFIGAVSGGIMLAFSHTTESNELTIQASYRLHIRDGSATGTILESTAWNVLDFSLYRYYTTGGEESVTTNWHVATTAIKHVVDSLAFTLSSTNHVTVEITRNGVPFAETWVGDIGASFESSPYVASLTTSTIDLGETSTAAAQFIVDDVRPATTGITYTAYADDFDPPTTNRGAVVDGANIGSVGYRFHRIKADFTAESTSRAQLREMSIIGGNSQFKHFSTHAGEPIAAAMQGLTEKAISTLSSKIDLVKFASTGEVSVTMPWNRETGDLLATGYLKNKTVKIRDGFLGLPEPDFETGFSGTWHDYTADHAKKKITVKLQNVLNRISKRQLPEEKSDTAGNKKTTPLDWVNVNGIQIVLDILDLLGVPDRELDRPEFEAIRDGARSGWNLTRRIEDPVDAGTLLAELSVTMGVFLSPQPTGLLKPIIYDPDASTVANLDARNMEFGPVDGGQKQLFTRQKVYYNANTAKPSGSEHYANVLVFKNDASEARRGEKIAEREWFDKWGINSTIAATIGLRFDSWFADPHFSVSVSKVPPHLLGIMPGQIVTVDNLELPVPAANYGDLSAGAKFLVMARNHDPQTGGLKLDLYDVQTAGTPGAGVVGTDLELSGATSIKGAGNTYTAAAGVGAYSWDSTVGTLSATTGTSVDLDVTGVAHGTAGTIQVSDDTGTLILRFEVNNLGALALADAVDWSTVVDDGGKPASGADVTDYAATQAQANAAIVVANAYADDIVTIEEARAIADATAKANAASLLADWSGVTGTGKPASGADVTLDNTAGNGTNVMVPYFSSDFDAGLVPLGWQCVPSIFSGTIGGRTGSFLKVNHNTAASNAITYLLLNIADHPIKVTTGKKFIVSFQVLHDTAVSVWNQYNSFSFVGKGGSSMTASFDISSNVNTWRKVSIVLDPVTPGITEEDWAFWLNHPDGTQGNFYFDQFMVEEMVGTIETPSAYSKPVGLGAVSVPMIGSSGTPTHSAKDGTLFGNSTGLWFRKAGAWVQVV